MYGNKFEVWLGRIILLIDFPKNIDEFLFCCSHVFICIYYYIVIICFVIFPKYLYIQPEFWCHMWGWVQKSLTVLMWLTLDWYNW